MLTSINKFLLILSRLFEKLLIIFCQILTNTYYNLANNQIHCITRSFQSSINGFKIWFQTNYNFDRLFTEFYEFGYKKNVLMSSSIENYINGETIPFRRLIRISISILSCLLIIIRCSLLALTGNRLVRILMADISLHLIKGTILCVLFSIWALCFFLGTIILHHFEYYHRLKFLDYFYILAQNRSPIQLSYERNKRLIFVTNLMLKCILHPFYYLLFSFFFSFLLYFIIDAYFAQNSVISLIALIMWSITTYLFIKLTSALIVLLLVVCVFGIMYLSYAFVDIANRIRLESKLKNIRPLMKTISEHNFTAKMVTDLNEFFRLFLFGEYYTGSPACMLVLYLIFHEDNNISILILYIIMGISIYSFVFLVNMACAFISRSAKRPRIYLYKCFTRNQLTVKQKLRIFNFIEKLCGPDIGFYCYDLFPMNNYEFYEYCANCLLMYLLFNTLVFDSLFSKFK